MNRTDFHALMERTFAAVKAINNSKGQEYASDDEALANFYNRAEEYGVDPKVVCGILWGKHVDAVKAFIRTGDVRSEPIEGRVHDVILYSVLLLGLVEDHRSDEQAIVEHAGENQLALLDEQARVRTLDEVREDRMPLEAEACDAARRNPVEDTVTLPAMPALTGGPGGVGVPAADPAWNLGIGRSHQPTLGEGAA